MPIAFIVFLVMIAKSGNKRHKEYNAKVLAMKDEAAKLEGKFLSGQKLTEAEGVRLAHLKTELQNIAAQNAANQINMNNNLTRRW